MCGLAHVLEAEGVATVVIGLIGQHVRAMRPPRALVVPFDLGRPLGAPNAPALQSAVVRAALGLLDRPGPGPLVAAFDAEVPARGATGIAAAVCPVSFPEPPAGSSLEAQVRAEMRALRPWFERGREARGHTATGMSGLDPEEAASWLAAFLDASPPADSPVPGQPLAETFKLAVEDVKAFYLEAVTAEPNPGSAAEIDRWFWDETAAGELLRALRERLAGHPDGRLALYAAFTLVPEGRLVRRGRDRTKG